MSAVDSAFLELAREIIAALDMIPSPAALLDERGTIQWQNGASLDLRGRRVGSDFAEFLAPDDRPAARSLFASLLNGGDTSELGVHALNAEGEYVELVGRWNVIPLRAGRKVVVVLNLGDRKRPPGPADSLTPRQVEVLRLLADGQSTGEIARALSLSKTTVRNHIANLLYALGVHSRLQAVVVARARGHLES